MAVTYPDTVRIKSGDTGRAWLDTLELGGSAINLTGATVEILISRDDVVSEYTATVVSAAAGTVSYQPTAEDVEAGTLFIEWRITFSDERQLTVPSLGAIRVVIEAAIEA